MKTREKIVKTAIELFNKNCATNVSTVQLAQYMDISPGNLYYYFENKEHIIRAIWEESFLPGVHKIFEDIASTADTKEAVYNLVDRYLHLVYDHRFLYTELNSLLFNDPLLRKHFQTVYNMATIFFVDKYRLWREKGMLCDIDEDLLSTMYHTHRLALHSFMTYQILVMGRDNADQIASSAFMKVLQANQAIVNKEAYAYLEQRLLEAGADVKDLI